MSIELSAILAVAVFNAAASLIGISIAVLAFLSGLLTDKRSQTTLRMKIKKSMLIMDVQKLFSRLKKSIGLYAVSLLFSFSWLLLIEAPTCQNEIIASPIFHGCVYITMVISIASFVLAFIFMVSNISSIDFRMMK